jgi:tetratricopeptide (TPR) repeat protein
MGSVYKAYDRLNRNYVALKRVSEASDDLAPSSSGDSKSDIRTALAHEFQTLASLHHPHVINVLDYGFDEEQIPYFIMNLLEDATPITDAAKDESLERKIELLVEMLQALAYLHRRGVIHRDLKPDNALVTKEGEVKVLDFGLAALREKREAEQVVGTLSYIAPEVLQGQPATGASDLYAVGLIAYQMIAGSHPYHLDDPTQLVQDILFITPDVDALDVNAEMTQTIERLLQKDPADRFQDAYEVIEALSAAMNQPVPEETQAIRESYLQAAQFVGRDAELEQLTDALAAALQGKGSGWLVGGESGVGKTRLLDELRIQALVRGALVVHGQGIAEGGQSYQLWRPVLRRLVLSTDITDLETSTLKELIPDIGQLLGREVANAPELGGPAGQERLLNTIASLIKKQHQPLLILLEDLQWATESLDVLNYLNPLVAELPLLIIGNYRDDERPTLPDELPGMQVIKLERLSDEGIEQLSVSMLGDDTGGRPEIVELLKKETEGNVFFLVEVVRTLAEEAGRLSDIGRLTLPQRVFAGGVEAVVQRRLNRVPAEARALLPIAAVLGRELDLKVLQAVEPATNLENWLTICSNVAVLEMVNQQWRFAHDRLRTGLLASLDDDERRRLHLQAAETIQQVYADELDEYAIFIADHYEAAEMWAIAANWYRRAGKYAEKTHAPAAAITFYRKALDYWTDDSGSVEDKITIYQGLGATLHTQGRFDEGIQNYLTMRSLAEESGNKAKALVAIHGISTAYFSQGDVTKTAELLEEEILLASEIGAELQFANALFLKGWTAYARGELATAIDLARQALKISEETADDGLVAQCVLLLGVVYSATGQYNQSAEYYQQALELAEKRGDKGQSMYVISNLGEVDNLRGNYQRARERYEKALSIAREIGQRGIETISLNNLGGVHVRLGEYQEAEALLREAIRNAEYLGRIIISETYRFLAEALLGQNRIEGALSAASRALHLGQDAEAKEYIAAAWRVLGMVAADYPGSIIILDDENPYMPHMCFEKSAEIFREGGMEGQLAHTLREWARYELRNGDPDKGKAMWEEARDLFRKLGADMEAERMSELPV